MSDPKWDVTLKPIQEVRPRPASYSTFGSFSVPGTRAGAVVSLGLVVIAWLAIPLARPFMLGAGGLGVLIGSILWWKHNQ
jgi:hypothetical protein